MQLFFKSFLFRIFMGLLIVCVVPALMLPGWNLPQEPFTRLHVISVVIVALSFTGSMLVLNRLNWFPGTRSLFAGIPILGIWYGLLSLPLLLLRQPYSISYLSMGASLSLLLLLLQSAAQAEHQKRMAYVPLGRTNNMQSIKGIHWLRLEEPVLPENYQKLDAIVADLHAPALTDSWQKFLAECALQHIPVYNIRQIEEALTGRVKIHHMYENTLGSLLPSPVYVSIKYVFEVALILCLLPIVLPIMLIAAIAIKAEDGGRIFYNQERVGYRGKPFKMYKFRSMTENEDINQETVTQSNDTRITKIGRFIRKMRIDELPQFLNVIFGTMSLIGPRAEYKKFADELEVQVPFYQYRQIVRPGITGWAQVMHGYATGADETQIKIEYDFYYIKNFSFSLDFLIILKTIRTVLTGFGAR